MSLPENAEAQTHESGLFCEQDTAASMSRQRANPVVSDVRGLSVRDEATSVVADSGTREPNLVIPPLGTPWTFDERQFGEEPLPLDGEFLLALRSSDSDRALLWLLRDNARLRLELASVSEDFECLRELNVSIQEQLNVALGAADDVRLALASELERAKDQVLDLEARLQDACSRLNDEVTRSQSERDALQAEIVELRAEPEDQ
jgi:hypothetical protein